MRTRSPPWSPLGARFIDAAGLASCYGLVSRSPSTEDFVTALHRLPLAWRRSSAAGGLTARPTIADRTRRHAQGVEPGPLDPCLSATSSSKDPWASDSALRADHPGAQATYAAVSPFSRALRIQMPATLGSAHVSVGTTQPLHGRLACKRNSFRDTPSSGEKALIGKALRSMLWTTLSRQGPRDGRDRDAEPAGCLARREGPRCDHWPEGVEQRLCAQASAPCWRSSRMSPGFEIEI